MKMRQSAWVVAFLIAWLPATGRWGAAEQAKDKKSEGAKAGEAKDNKEIVRPVRNNVGVRSSYGVLIGVLDKDAEVEVLLKSGDWCKVQYTKDGNRFVGWVAKEDLALTDTPPPDKGAKDEPKVLSPQETSEQLRKLVRVYVDYKSTRGESWNPDTSVGVNPTRMGDVQMVLKFDDKGTAAKLVVLARFRRDHVIQLFIEKRIVELKGFRNVADPVFDRVIDSYIRALESYNDGKVPDFKRLVESAERFWESVEGLPE